LFKIILIFLIIITILLAALEGVLVLELIDVLHLGRHHTLVVHLRVLLPKLVLIDVLKLLTLVVHQPFLSIKGRLHWHIFLMLSARLVERPVQVVFIVLLFVFDMFIDALIEGLVCPLREIAVLAICIGGNRLVASVLA